MRAGGGTPRRWKGARPLQVDAGLTAYQKVSGVSGSLSSIGSDTMNNMMTFWAETFRKMYPNVKIQVEGKGSTTAAPALINGTAQFGPMSREMRGAEIDQFEAKYGYKPTQLRTSYDALAVYVNKDNPIEKLTLAQVEADLLQVAPPWLQGRRQDLGPARPDGDWASRPISLYGRNAASGTYGFFKEIALKNGDYKTTVKEQPGSASVVQGITEDRFGIGYSGSRLQDVRRQGRAACGSADRDVLGRRVTTTSRPGSIRCRASCSFTSTRRQANRSTRSSGSS